MSTGRKFVVATALMLFVGCSGNQRQDAHTAIEKACEARKALDVVCPLVEAHNPDAGTAPDSE